MGSAPRSMGSKQEPVVRVGSSDGQGRCDGREAGRGVVALSEEPPKRFLREGGGVRCHGTWGSSIPRMAPELEEGRLGAEEAATPWRSSHTQDLGRSAPRSGPAVGAPRPAASRHIQEHAAMPRCARPSAPPTMHMRPALSPRLKSQMAWLSASRGSLALAARPCRCEADRATTAVRALANAHI